MKAVCIRAILTSIYCALVLSVCVPAPAYAQAYTTLDIVSLLNRLGGYRGPARALDGSYEYPEITYSASVSGDIVTIVQVHRARVRSNIKTAQSCTAGPVTTVTFTFATGDMSPSVKIEATPVGTPFVMVHLTTKGDKRLINFDQSIGAPTCPVSSFEALFGTRGPTNRLLLYIPPDAAERFSEMVATVWK